MVERVDLEAAEQAGKVMMALRKQILDAQIPVEADKCAARLQALSLFDIAVILSSPIVEAVESEAPENVPMFAAQARAQATSPAATPQSLLRWAQAMAAKGYSPAGEEWNAWFAAVSACVGPLPEEPPE